MKFFQVQNEPTKIIDSKFIIPFNISNYDSYIQYFDFKIISTISCKIDKDI